MTSYLLTAAAPCSRHLLLNPLKLKFPQLAKTITIRRRRRIRPAASSAAPPQGSEKRSEWDSTTAKLAGASNLPFLLIQLPQILLNYQNLVAGDRAALFAVPWLSLYIDLFFHLPERLIFFLTYSESVRIPSAHRPELSLRVVLRARLPRRQGMLTGLLGNLTLLSYFAKKKEKEAILVQTLGVVSIYVVIAQLALAGAMPLPQFIVTSVVVSLGLVLNFMNYFGWLQNGIWRLWEDFITVGGLSVLPQVMWSTFVPFVPSSILPGTISCTLALAAVVMARTGKLSEAGTMFVGSVSGWTATLLFMWMPIAQMWTNYLNPDNIKGLSALTLLLGMIGNALMIPRALFIRDLMWFTGASWASILQGWGNLLCMYCLSSINREFFFGATVGLFIWLGTALWQDMLAYGYSSPVRSMKELIFG